MSGNRIRWDAPQVDGTVYGVTTDNMVTVEIIPMNYRWHVYVADRNGAMLASAEVSMVDYSSESVLIWATQLVNRTLLHR